jgi:hypothetical protein
MNKAYETFKKYAVNDVSSVEEFLKKYTKHSRLEGRDDVYNKTRLESYQKEYDELGFTFMTHHESKSGEVVSFYKSL